MHGEHFARANKNHIQIKIIDYFGSYIQVFDNQPKRELLNVTASTLTKSRCIKAKFKPFFQYKNK